MMSGAAAITASAVTMRSLALLCTRERREHLDAARDLDQLRHPLDAGDHRLVPFLEIDPRAARQSRGLFAHRVAAGPRSDTASASAFSAAPTSAPSVRIMSRMPATSRWLKAWTAMLRRISSAAMSACRSEKVSTRSGFERDDLLEVGRNERRDARLLAPHLRRPHRVARHADNAMLLAEEIQRLDGFFGQADDAGGRKHRGSIEARAAMVETGFSSGRASEN